MDCITKGLKNEVGIYKITNLSNMKCYIGQSVLLRKRYIAHKNLLLSNSHHNKHLQNAYNKGEKIVFEVLEFCSIDDIDEREKMWISFFDSRNRTYGYNFDVGGNINRDRHPETLMKQSHSMKLFYSDESKRIELSIKKSTISPEMVARIKITLSEDLDATCLQVANKLKVNVNSVAHIQQLASHTYILNNLNYIINNRAIISDKRKSRKILTLYRCGFSYKEISEMVGVHQRNVIRKVKENKNEHDDRCRLNSINRSILKRDSLIKTLYGMGKNTVEINHILRVSRVTIRKVLNGESELFTDVSQTRGKFKINYRHS